MDDTLTVNAAALISLGRVQDAYDLLLPHIDTDEVDDLLLMSAFFMNARDYRVAEEFVSAAYEMAPDDPTVLQFMGQYHMHAGQTRTARTYLEDALSLARGNPVVMLAMSELEITVGNFALAEELLTDALEEYAIPNLYYTRAVARFNRQDFQGAADDCTEALAGMPIYDKARELRSHALRELGREDEADTDRNHLYQGPSLN